MKINPNPEGTEFRQLLHRATVGLILALGVPMLALFWVVLFLLNSSHWVDHSDQVLAEVNHAERLLVTMQSGFRGYLLIRDKSILETYTQAHAEIEPCLSRLEYLVSDNPHQQALAMQFRAQVKNWAKMAEDSLDRVAAGGSPENETADLQVSRESLQSAFETGEAFIAAENRLRGERSQRLQNVVATLMAVFGTMVILGIPVLSWGLQRSLRKVGELYQTSLTTTELRAAELEVTLKSIGDAVIATDKDGKVEFLNPVAETLTGWAAVDARGRELVEIFRIFNEQTGAVVANPVERVLRENIIVGLANHTVLEARNGMRVPIEDSAAPIRNQKGEVAGVILVFHDVSLKRASEIELADKEWRLRSALELGGAGSWVWDIINDRVTGDMMLAETFGVAPEKCLTGEPMATFLNAVHEDDRGHLQTALERAKDNTGEAFQCECRVGSENGQERWVHARGRLEKDAAGRPAKIIGFLIDINERKKAEERERHLMVELVAANAKFRAVFDQTIIFAGIMNLDGTLVDANKLCLGACGYRAEEVLGRPFWETAWWRNSKEVQDKIRNGYSHAAQGTPYREALPYWWADETERVMDFILHPILDHQGQVNFLHPTGMDITERIRTEEALRETNQKLQTVLSSFSDGLAMLDKDWRYTYINEQGASIIGLRPEQVLGRNIWELFPHTAGTKFDEFYRRAMETRLPVQFEEFYPEPLNLWLECRCYPSPDGLSVYFHDITARKQGEALLRQNEALFSALVDLAPQGVYVVDADFRLQQINARALPAFEKVHPRTGRDFSEVMHILWGPEVGGEIVKIFRHTLETGERYISPRFSEFRQDLGEDRSYEWETQRVTLPDGKHGVVCYFNDITERTRSEQTLLEAKATAESANRSKDQFLAALSHELRTPLNPALLIASESADNHELPEQVRLNFETIRKNIELEARLIDDLLDLTRITAGKMILDRERLDVHGVLIDALATVQAGQQEKNIQMTLKLEAATAQVEGDAVRLQQVFWNILKNAVKFTPREGKITIETLIKEDCLVVRFADTGIGMNSSELARVFSAFAQGDHAGPESSHRFGGLGLGLAISKNLVELHSGTIIAESAGKGLGSNFTIKLPLSKENAKDGREINPHTPKHKQFEKLDHSSTPLSVLLVEDHEITRTVLTQLLARRNYRVVAADSIAKARTIASNDKFDLIISDIGLPDGNGNELMNEFREQYGLKGIALTGYGMEEDIARGKAAGFVTHLIKPVRIQSLENALALIRNAG